MANIKSQKKRIRQDEGRRVRNMAIRSKMRTLTKKAVAALEAKDEASINAAVPAAISAIDRAVSKGVLHRNSAARKKSMLAHRRAAL